MFVAVDQCALILHSLVCKVIHATTGDCFFSRQAHLYGISIISNASTKRLEVDLKDERLYSLSSLHLYVHVLIGYTQSKAQYARKASSTLMSTQKGLSGHAPLAPPQRTSLPAGKVPFLVVTDSRHECVYTLHHSSMHTECKFTSICVAAIAR